MKVLFISIIFAVILFLGGLDVVSVNAVTIFDDELLNGVEYLPFANTDGSAVSVDSMVAFEGAASLKFRVPDPEVYPYLGGALVADQDFNLTGYNALTFYARASENIALDIIGFGHDNTVNGLYEASLSRINLTGDWSFFVVPIPAPSKLIAERGLFTIAEGPEEAYPNGYDIYIDQLQYAQLANIEIFRPSVNVMDESIFVGSQFKIAGANTVFRVDGVYVRVDHDPAYFDYESDALSVAVTDGSTVTVVGAGEARITGTLENPADPEAPVDVLGGVLVTGFEPPAVAAPVPTHPAGNVISLFSDVYSDVHVDTWRADWYGVTTQVQDYVVSQDNTKMYNSLNWVGVEFFTIPIDASAMTHFHLDVYVPGGTDFRFFLVSFPDGGTGGVPTVEIVLDADSTPALVNEQWMSVDIPLTDLQPEDPTFDWSSLSQLVFASADARLVLVDNVLFVDKSYLSPVIGISRVLAQLFDSFPNPFNPQTTIAFEIPSQQDVALRVFDLSGRLVRNLIVGESRTPGRHEVVWNGRDDAGRKCASGTYFYRLEAGSFAETKRMVLVK